MAIELTMPKLSDTMEEGKILKWLVKEGDTVSTGDIIAEIETDKADMEYETIDEGTVLKIIVGEGESAPVGKLIAVIGEEGEEVDVSDSGGEEKEDKPAEEEAKEEKEEPEEKQDESEEAEIEEQKIEITEKDKESLTPANEVAAKEAAAMAGGAVKASPVARKLADAAGVDIKDIKGSGPDGRVIKRDVEQHLGGDLPEVESEYSKPKEEMPAEKPAEEKPKEEPKKAEPAKEAPAPVVAKLEGKREPMSGMRKTIAKRLVQSKVEVPHFYLTVEVDMDELMLARASLNEIEGVKLSVNDFIIKACAQALLQHPQVNAHVDGEEIVYNDAVDIGMAVAIDEGLITPYIRAAHTKSLSQIAAESGELAGRARNRKLKPEEYSGGSFTVSNLGMFGIDHFTAIINPPESTILAVGAAKEVPVVVDDEIDIAWRMNMTLSCDHRIVDGATGAKFLQTLVSMLESPMRMLL